MKNIFIFIFCFFASLCFSYQYELSICTIFRDEAPYLKEWIEYHRMLGVQHFYLCNHNSIDDYKEVLKPYIKKGIVELKEISNEPDADLITFCYSLQAGWYNECLIKYKDESKWIAFIDSDEFLCLNKGWSLRKFLKDYEEFGGVVVSWFMFGTSNKNLDKHKLMIEQLKSCFEPPYICVGSDFSSFFKSIVQTKYAVKFVNPHFAEYVEGYFAVNANKESLGDYPNVKIPAVYDTLKLNHYWTKDEGYFWKTKVPRQIQLYGNCQNYLEYYKFFNKSKNYDIQRFVPTLRKRMGLD